ncbi:MAG: DUF3576 domain-containing protein [Rhodospirillaceae bacterium]
MSHSLRAQSIPARMGQRPARRGLGIVALGLVTALGLSACGAGEQKFQERRPGETKPTFRAPGEQDPDKLFGPDGLSLNFGSGGSGTAGPGEGGGIGVNSFLWRASLDTVGFMPLTSADPFGGVIITDWYVNNATPDERFKINIYILSKALRADGVKVSAFRQIRDVGSSSWLDAPVSDNVSVDFENAILTKARQLRLAVLEGS